MKKKLPLVIIFFLIQSTFANLGHPVTPALVRGLGLPDYMFGVFFATMSFGLMIGAPIWGILGDQGNKKKYIVFGLLLYSIGQFAFGYSNNPYLMVLFRFVSGFGAVSASTLLITHVIELSPKDKRARNLAYVAAAVTLGGSLGYYLGGFLSTNAWATGFFHITEYKQIFLIQALLNTFYAALIFFFYIEVENKVILPKKLSMFKSMRNITKISSSLLLFLLSLTFIMIGATNLSKYIDVYFNELGYTPQDLGTFVMATGVASLLACIFIVPLFAKLRKQVVAITIIQTLSAVIVFYVFRANQFLLVIYTVYMLYVVIKAIYQPLEQNYISLHANEGEFGRIMGLRQSFVSIGMVIGPLVGGFLYQKKPLFLFDSSAVAFLIGAGLLLIVLILEKRKRGSDLND